MLKKTFISTTVILLLAGSFASCLEKDGNKDDVDEDVTTRSSEDFFYYCFDEKIYLNQSKDKILLRFSQDADTKQIQTFIGSYVSLRIMEENSDLESPTRIAALESKNGKHIELETIESLSKDSKIVSVNYLFEIKGKFLGVTDEFYAQLKENISYEQLVTLAEKNNCKVGDKKDWDTNVFMLHVSKTSELNAMQMSCLFYETGLFEYAAPNFRIFDFYAKS